ncbi:hypothetical protein HAL1_05128 [Halomonas sp. HAL1]|nr:hypothetical protein HAL1_05128 [Halomonas sp. HAL1]
MILVLMLLVFTLRMDFLVAGKIINANIIKVTLWHQELQSLKLVNCCGTCSMGT